MSVPDCAMEGGNISEGKTPLNDFTFLSAHNICVVSIQNLSISFARYLREMNYLIPDKIYT